MVLLGIGVSLTVQFRLGMAAWDALNNNFVVGLKLNFKIVGAAVAIILSCIVYLLNKKKVDLVMLFPVAVSLTIGAVIDAFKLFIPKTETLADLYGLGYFWDGFYLIIATILIAIGLNLIIYTDFPLPALDQFCNTLSKKLHITFGQSKYLGEAIAVMASIIFGELLGNRSEIYFLGLTTLYFLLILGAVIDLFKFPLYRLLGAVTKVEMFADDMLKEDINKKSWRKTSRAIIIKDDKILLEYIKIDDFYILPGGGKERFETLERCLKREVLEETGYKIKNIDEKAIVMEYLPHGTFENHYYIAKLKSDTIFTDKIKQTKQEIEQGIELLWVDKIQAITLLDEYDTKHEVGTHIMNREFLGIINSI